jgi:hypothetical protein
LSILQAGNGLLLFMAIGGAALVLALFLAVVFWPKDNSF